MAAGGGEACSDIKVLRSEPEVFAEAPSVSTVHRLLNKMTAAQVQTAAAAMAEVRQRVWPMMGITPDAEGELTSGIDASACGALGEQAGSSSGLQGSAATI